MPISSTCFNLMTKQTQRSLTTLLKPKTHLINSYILFILSLVNAITPMIKSQNNFINHPTVPETNIFRRQKIEKKLKKLYA